MIAQRQPMHSPEALKENLVIREAVCPHDCPDACRLLVHVDKDTERVVRISGDPQHPITQGFLCVKVNNYVERVYSPDRVLYPLRRVGPKGSGRFERISWDEAVATIGAAMRAAIASDGPESILPYSYAGTMGALGYGSMDRRFFHALGASQLERSICSSAGGEGYTYTIGNRIGMDTEDYGHARLILLWGANPVSTNVHLVPFLKQAQRNGARIVLIDPRRSRSAEIADQHLAIRPATDAALALGMMHVIITEDLYDHDYVQAYTVGFDALVERAREYPPDRVAAITGLSVQDIVTLARDYATARPAAIRLNYGMQRHAHGGMAVRTVACLPALVGSWREQGGGAQLSTSGAFPFNYAALQRPDLIPGDKQPRTINMNRLGEALTSAQPPVRVLYVYNSNPAAVAPRQELVLAGLRRDDLFVAVHEQMLTDTARYADIVLPATTAIEQSDLYYAYGHYYVQTHRPAIAPLGEAVPNTEAFRRLARQMELTHSCFQDSDDNLIDQALSSERFAAMGITPQTLRAAGSLRVVSGDGPFLPFAQGEFPTPSGKCEFYSEHMKAAGYDPLPAYSPPAEGPDSTPQLFARYPINLVAAKAHHFLNSTFANLPRMRRHEKEPLLELNSADAAHRGIVTGDLVRVYNDRGSTILRAVVGETVPAGVAAHSSIWWHGASPIGDAEDGVTQDGPAPIAGSGNINATTSDQLADMGGGATFFNNLVQIELYGKDN